MNMFKWQLLNTAALPREGEGAGAAPAVQEWATKITDAEVKGYFENRGLHTKPIEEALLSTAKAHREAEKFVGAPANEIVRLPKPTATPAEKAEFYSKLGRPADMKDYDFSGIKDEALATKLREGAFQNGLSKDAAGAIAKSVAEHMEKLAGDDAAKKAGILAENKAELAKQWKGHEIANKDTAQKGAALLGVQPAEVEALESVIGYAKIMEMFRRVGAGMSEDTIPAGGGGGGQVLTLDGAKTRKAELMADAAWRGRFLSGGVQEVQEMARLDKIIAGVA